MKICFTGLLFFLLIQLNAQPATEVFVMDLDQSRDSLVLDAVKNISNNPGYDNQPSFYSDDLILFSATRNGQTDIAAYDLKKDQLSWITDTPGGSEYSPLKVPGKKAFSAIRLDKDDTQLLYVYGLEDGRAEILLKDLKVGYHLWYSKEIVVATVLVEDRMDLVVANLRDGTIYTFQRNVGRSLQKIPNSDRISFIHKETEPWEIKSLDPVTGATEKITTMPNGVADLCWLSEETIIAGQGNRLLKFEPGKEARWRLIKNFRDKQIHNITRLSVNREGTAIALVASRSPEFIVQQQLDAYNSRDIKAFMATYSEDIELFAFPDKLLSKGKEKMREQYLSFFEKTPDLHAEIKKRMVLGNKVIDQETVTANGKELNAVAIYEVQNEKIIKVTFIQ